MLKFHLLNLILVCNQILFVEKIKKKVPECKTNEKCLRKINIQISIHETKPKIEVKFEAKKDFIKCCRQ